MAKEINLDNWQLLMRADNNPYLQEITIGFDLAVIDEKSVLILKEREAIIKTKIGQKRNFDEKAILLENEELK